MRKLQFTASNTHPHKATAHVGIGNREVWLGDGLLEDEVNDALEALLCVNGQLCDLLHQLLEHLWRQFVQNATHPPEQIL